MVFNSFAFAVFFVAVYGLYLATLRRLRAQNLMLLLASNVFYGWWDYRFLGLLWLSTLIDYFLARRLDRRQGGIADTDAPYADSPRARHALMVGSVVVNLGILGFFKYFNFFADSTAALLSGLGLHLHPRTLNIILPVGISFYTFQSLSYTIDVYRGRIRAVPHLLDFALFVSFFPQLVAGPIVRASEFIPQVLRRRRLEYTQVCEGGYLILWGLFQKMVIADNLARLVDRVFDPSTHVQDGQLVLLGTYAFAVQIYCDFAGYTDIARGCAKLMGFEFALNFNLPYVARNPSDFWRRWHISLSSWLRDYLYIPLGGNRGGTWHTSFNLMATMVLGGLWHGAAWTFVIWGTYHGLLLIVHRALKPWLDALAARTPARLHPFGRILAVIGFFQLTCLGWLFFRAESVAQIGAMLSALLKPWPWWLLQGANRLYVDSLVTLAAFTLPLVFMHLLQVFKQDLVAVLRFPALARGLAYATMFFGLMWYGGVDDRPFIYFQF